MALDCLNDCLEALWPVEAREMAAGEGQASSSVDWPTKVIFRAIEEKQEKT